MLVSASGVVMERKASSRHQLPSDASTVLGDSDAGEVPSSHGDSPRGSDKWRDFAGFLSQEPCEFDFVCDEPSLCVGQTSPESATPGEILEAPPAPRLKAAKDPDCEMPLLELPEASLP
eukprot:TRINITY_DN80001_c0_g1_i1.p3 TRINITY_DN80001_c0_g1~~TRINITY_DN80001_c0_g1_i1.p3  ORF type:complete len:119 (+),score=23.37 TRINITY_DN80001_c0_g1_i1:162-518(+)